MTVEARGDLFERFLSLPHLTSSVDVISRQLKIENGGRRVSTLKSMGLRGHDEGTKGQIPCSSLDVGSERETQEQERNEARLQIEETVDLLRTSFVHFSLLEGEVTEC